MAAATTSGALQQFAGTLHAARMQIPRDGSVSLLLEEAGQMVEVYPQRLRDLLS